MMYYAEFMPERLKNAGILEAIDWVMLELNLPEHVHVAIEFKRMALYSQASVMDQDYDPEEDDGWWFDIEISSRLKKDDVIRAIFHEMIHIKQMSTGRLQYINGQPYWLGKKMVGLDYNNRPWEIEAFDKENELLHKYTMYKQSKMV